MLPGIDDGSKSLEMSLEMARMAVADGITAVACTPHILPGVYNNTGPAIRDAVARLRDALAQSGIPLQVMTGADVHVAPDLASQLKSGGALTINNSRYLLLEPPHHVPPPRLEDYIFGLKTAGFIPILTHPERLSWISGQYSLIQQTARTGTLMQLTAGSLLGQFGGRARYWAERMLDEGMCDILATDAHNLDRRPPSMAAGRDAAARRVGDEEAINLVLTRPRAIIENVAPSQLAVPARAEPQSERSSARHSVLAYIKKFRGTK